MCWQRNYVTSLPIERFLNLTSTDVYAVDILYEFLLHSLCRWAQRTQSHEHKSTRVHKSSANLRVSALHHNLQSSRNLFISEMIIPIMRFVGYRHQLLHLRSLGSARPRSSWWRNREWDRDIGIAVGVITVLASVYLIWDSRPQEK